MKQFNTATLLLLAIGVILVIVLCADARGVQPDGEALISRHVDDELRIRSLSKRDVEDEEDVKPKRKGKKKPKSSTTLKPSTSPKPSEGMSSTTPKHSGDGSTTPKTSSGGSTTVKVDPSTTNDPSSNTTSKKPGKKGLNYDDLRMEEEMNDQKEEKMLIEKASKAFKAWYGWALANDMKTFNRDGLIAYLKYVRSNVIKILKNRLPSPGSESSTSGGSYSQRFGFTRLR